MKRIVIAAMVSVMFSSISFANSSLRISSEGITPPIVESSESDKIKKVKIENTVCPVDGREIYPENIITYGFEGKEYNFCCPKCIDKFMKSPQEYIVRIEKNKLEKIRGR